MQHSTTLLTFSPYYPGSHLCGTFLLAVKRARLCELCFIGILHFALLFSAAGAEQLPSPVYSHDFEKAPGKEWSHKARSQTPKQKRQFLGNFGPGTVTLSLAKLPAHKMLQLEFDGDADGSGTFIIGAEINIDPETHKIQIAIGSTAPATISNLKKQN